jgi:hypothetical protein
VTTWTSRRELDQEALRITFRQEDSQVPIASMGGSWLFQPLPYGGTELVLDHDFTAVDDDPGSLDWIARAVARNSAAELGALGRVATLDHPVDELVLTFSDEVRLPGPAAGAYDFVHRSDAWPEQLPHVRRVVLHEDPQGVQDMEMDTVTTDGSVHRTRSVRLCWPTTRIVYKQLVPPTLLLGHTGSWLFEPDADGTVVTARHTVAIDPAAVPAVLGPDATLADARAHLRDVLGANSRGTLHHAARHLPELGSAVR